MAGAGVARRTIRSARIKRRLFNFSIQILNWCFENLEGCGCVFLAHQDSESGAGPRNVRPHATGCVGLNHSVNTGGFESALRYFSFRFTAEILHDDELGFIHGSMLPAIDRTSMGTSNYFLAGKNF